jgi:hypothetical protein
MSIAGSFSRPDSAGCAVPVFGDPKIRNADTAQFTREEFFKAARQFSKMLRAGPMSRIISNRLRPSLIRRKINEQYVRVFC